MVCILGFALCFTLVGEERERERDGKKARARMSRVWRFLLTRFSLFCRDDLTAARVHAGHEETKEEAKEIDGECDSDSSWNLFRIFFQREILVRSMFLIFFQSDILVSLHVVVFVPA